MPLHIRDAEVSRMATELARLRGVSKTEAVRRALRHELEAQGLVERGLAFAAALRDQAGPDAGKPIDKAFIDSLYDPN